MMRKSRTAEERRAAQRIATAKWRAKPGSKEKEKLSSAVYRASPHGRAVIAAYAASPKGRAVRRGVQVRSNAKRQGHRVSDEGRIWMLEQQGGACAMSGCDRDATVVDHDHTTGEVRGMLCQAHNLGLGHFQDDPEELRWAIQFLSPFS